jgi:hypothetical protein
MKKLNNIPASTADEILREEFPDPLGIIAERTE